MQILYYQEQFWLGFSSFCLRPCLETFALGLQAITLTYLFIKLTEIANRIWLHNRAVTCFESIGRLVVCSKTANDTAQS